LRDFFHMGFQRKVPGIEQPDHGVRIVAATGFGGGRASRKQAWKAG
jgi:hypothetical protein